MPPEMTFDYLAVQINADKATGEKLSLTMDFSDLKEAYALSVENCVLHYSRKPATMETRLTLTKATFDRMQTGELSAEQALTSGDIKIEGRREAVSEFVSLFEKPTFWFAIVTP